MTVSALVGVVPHTLRQRLAASREALARESPLVEAAPGQGLMLEGARVAGDATREAEAARARAQLARASEAEKHSAARLWPLPTLRQDVQAAMLRDEVAATSDFLPTPARGE